MIPAWALEGVEFVRVKNKIVAALAVPTPHGTVRLIASANLSRGERLARLSAAKQVLCAMERIMRNVNHAKVLDKPLSFKPSVVARVLMEHAGQNPRADSLLVKTYRSARNGDKRARAVARELSKLVTKVYIDNKGDEVGFLPLLAALPGVLAPFLPDIIKGAGALLQGAMGGNQQSVDKVKTIIDGAQQGNPQAIESLNAIKAANALDKAGAGPLPFPAPPGASATGGFGPMEALAMVNPMFGMAKEALFGKGGPLAAQGQAAAQMARNVAGGQPINALPVASQKPAQAADTLATAKTDTLFYLPSWNDKYGIAIRNAPTAVLKDVRDRAMKGLPYGASEPRTLRALVPLIEEELRGRGEPIAVEHTEKQKARQRDSGRRWWEAKSDSRAKRLSDAL